MSGYNFTNGTRMALHAAREAAEGLGHHHVGTEHLLLGVLDDPANAASTLVKRSGADADVIRATIAGIVTPGSVVDTSLPHPSRAREVVRSALTKVGRLGCVTTSADTPAPYTSRARKALECAMLEARDHDQSPVGTQYLLVGLLQEAKGVGGQVLMHCGVTLAEVAPLIDQVADLP